jgi:hypothetical protein
MILRLEGRDVDPLLLELVKKSGINLEGKQVSFYAHAGRKKNKGNYYFDAVIEDAVSEEPEVVPVIPEQTQETIDNVDNVEDDIFQ